MRLIRATIGLGLSLAAMLVGAPVGVEAQAPGDGKAPRTFGPTSSVSHTLHASAFVPSGNVSFVTNGLHTKFCQAPCIVDAPLLLPAGAIVTSIQLDSCDGSATAHLTAELVRVGTMESGTDFLASVDTGIAETPLCSLTTANLVPPHTIDNVNNAYTVSVGSTGSDASTRFAAVRVFYHLQVSPAPAVATFNDVPTNHPFFQFVEALAAAGITTGCSATPLLYCPDDPLTRGEAAAFFGKALGLHFAP